MKITNKAIPDTKKLVRSSGGNRDFDTALEPTPEGPKISFDHDSQ